MPALDPAKLIMKGLGGPAERISDLIELPLPRNERRRVLNKLDSLNSMLERKMRSSPFEYAGFASPSREQIPSLHTSRSMYEVAPPVAPDPESILAHSHPFTGEANAGAEQIPLALSAQDLLYTMINPLGGITSLGKAGDFGWAVKNPRGKMARLNLEDHGKELGRLLHKLTVEDNRLGREHLPLLQPDDPLLPEGDWAVPATRSLGLGLALKDLNILNDFGYQPGNIRQAKTTAKLMDAVGDSADRQKFAIKNIFELAALLAIAQGAQNANTPEAPVGGTDGQSQLSSAA